MRSGYEAEVFVPYDFQKEFEHVCGLNGVKIINKQYTDKVRNVIEISQEKYAELFEKEEISCFYELQGKVLRAKYIVMPQ